MTIKKLFVVADALPEVIPSLLATAGGLILACLLGLLQGVYRWLTQGLGDVATMLVSWWRFLTLLLVGLYITTTQGEFVYYILAGHLELGGYPFARVLTWACVVGIWVLCGLEVRVIGLRIYDDQLERNRAQAQAVYARHKSQ